MNRQQIFERFKRIRGNIKGRGFDVIKQLVKRRRLEDDAGQGLSTDAFPQHAAAADGQFRMLVASNQGRQQTAIRFENVVDHRKHHPGSRSVFAVVTFAVAVAAVIVIVAAVVVVNLAIAAVIVIVATAAVIVICDSFMIEYVDEYLRHILAAFEVDPSKFDDQIDEQLRLNQMLRQLLRHHIRRSCRRRHGRRGA